MQTYENFKNELNITGITYVHTIRIPEEGISLPKTENCILIYVNRGEIDVKSKTYNNSLTPSQLLVVKNDEPFLSPVNNSTANVVLIEFECDCLHLEPFNRFPQFIPFSLRNSLYRVVKEAHAVFLPTEEQALFKGQVKRENYPFGADQLTKIDLEYFLIMVTRRSLTNINFQMTALHEVSHLDSLIPAIQDYIDNNPQENFSIPNICNLFCTNKSTLCREFKKRVGTTLITYINQCKIQTAKTLIREGNMNFTEIAEYLQFTSIHYFSKLFTKYEQMSPSQYSKTINSYKLSKN